MTRGARLVIAGAIALLVGAVTLCTASGCYRDRLVPVTPRPCLTRPAPRVPPGAVYGSPRWITAYAELWRWVVAAELSCGVEPPATDTAFEDVP